MSLFENLRSMSNSNDKSFITTKGGLEVHLDPGKVTWFGFLGFSRAMNSLQGGWNSKTHWWRKGVLMLAVDGAEFIPRWTKNSLQKNARPLPRKDTFMFDRPPSPERIDLERRLKSREKPIDECSENELSYALLNKGFGIFKPLEGIDPLGYEIPLAQESDGQLKVDLFGFSPDSNAIEIIELKNGNNTSDSPLLALIEAMCYSLQTLRCMKSLLSKAPLAGHEKAFNQINLTLLAPGNYWNHWCKHDPGHADLRERFGTIVDYVNVGIKNAGVSTKLKLDLKNLELATHSAEGP